jgi:transposase
MSRRAAAQRFGVGVASAVRWVHEWRMTGASCAKPKGDDQRSHRIEAHRAVIPAAINAQVDITRVELAKLLRRDHRVSFAPSGIWRSLDRHAITIEKTVHVSEQARSDVAARHSAWFDNQPDLHPVRLVFIDENGASTKIARMRGRAKRG